MSKVASIECPHCGKEFGLRVDYGSDNTDAPRPATCRDCGETIYWLTGKSGKKYCVNNPDDRRDFHSNTCGKVGP